MSKFGKVLGILALVISGIACIFPGGALIATYVSAPLIIFSWKEGAIFGYIAGGLNIINILFLSPTVWLAMGLMEATEKGGAFTLGVIYVLWQVIAMGILGFINWKTGKKIKK